MQGHHSVQVPLQQRRMASEWAADQYGKLKATVPDHLLIMQVGNFYELYLDDAVKVNARLPLALSKKGMAGFPLHRKDAWIPQLQSLFSSVAVADQVRACVRRAGGGEKQRCLWL